MKIRHYYVLLATAAMCAPTLPGQQYMISTIAGNGSAGYTGDNGPAPAAQLNQPGAVALDSKGNLYIADGANNVIRMVANGTITTVAGNGTLGWTGDGAAATSAALNNPTGVAVDSSGNIYIADTGNSVIRKVTGGTITTFAGNIGNSGASFGYGGDGGPANAIGVLFNAPSSIALDSSGNLYISDSGNNLVRKVSGGNINSIVGTGPTAGKLSNPRGLAFDAAGNLYIADTGHSRVYMFNGTLTLVAGNGSGGFSGDNGRATAASVFDPAGVAVDSGGNLYIADSFNNRIRKVGTNGIITTIAGTGRTNYTGDGGRATLAALYFPKGVAVDSTGNVYVADTTNNAIRLLSAQTPAITGAGVVNAASLTAPISAGSLATVYGVNLASASATANPPLPMSLGGVSVIVNGQAAPIQYVTGTQVNFQVPWETTGATANVAVSLNGIASSAVQVALTPAAPGLFVDGNGNAVVMNPDQSLNTPSNPAPVGSTITALLTGSGPVSPAVADGANSPSDTPAMITLPATVTIGTEQGQVISAGLNPGQVGILQITFTVPDDMTTGSYPLVVGIGTEMSNAGTVSVTQ